MFGNLIQPILPVQAPVIFHPVSLAGYQDSVLGTGPLAYWPLDETGGTTVYDRSGHGYHGTYNGPALANTAAPGGGMAPSFDGTNDRADMQPVELLAALSHTELSLMVWARVLNAAVWTDGVYREVFHIRASATNRAYMIKPNTLNRFQFLYNGNDATTKLHEWTSQSGTGWLHLVQTISVANNRMNTYINGAAFATPSTAIAAWTGTPAIGLGCDGTGAWWKGWLAHAAIWNRPLSTAEVGVLYAGGL